MKIKPGQQAPDFSLYDSEKNKITLSDIKGHNILLLFFPLPLQVHAQQNFVQ